ncbi:helicase-related protein [Asanoa sp. NPDC049573]|uniref:helicase-related protein n=1 Tax=Asanoa sp. NPDC049573 TaxID=3155396 RepID=UPI00341AF66B
MPVAAAAATPPGEIELAFVGSLQNAAAVLAGPHAGEKRLVFCESRQAVEQLGSLLRERGITTFLSHASLSADERRRSEEAFAEARDCIIVSASTLELGIDVDDLDRVIQIDAARPSPSKSPAAAVRSPWPKASVRSSVKVPSPLPVR